MNPVSKPVQGLTKNMQQQKKSLQKNAKRKREHISIHYCSDVRFNFCLSKLNCFGAKTYKTVQRSFMNITNNAKVCWSECHFVYICNIKLSGEKNCPL